MATASGPVSEPEPTDPNAVHTAGWLHGLDERATQSSSPVPLELEDRKEYGQGQTEADPAYYEGMKAGRADTIHKRSSVTPPGYEGNDAYAKGYADGLAATPYLGDVEDEQKAEEDARIQSLPKLRTLDPSDVIGYSPDHPRPPAMGPISEDDQERAKEHTKDVEEVRRSLGESPEPHADPWVPKPIDDGEVPPIFGD